MLLFIGCVSWSSCSYFEVLVKGKVVVSERLFFIYKYK